MNLNRLKFQKMIATIALFWMGIVAMGQIATLPVIDGDTTDAIWNSAPVFNIKNVIQNPAINGPIDAKGTVRVLWSADSIYFLIHILDDSLYNLNTGNNSALNDVFKIYLDIKDQKTASFVDTTQQFWEIYWDTLNTIRGRKGPDWASPAPLHHVNVVTNHVGYVSEMAIGWNQLGLSPAAGDTIGIDFQVGDNDGLGDGMQQDILSWHDQTGLVYGSPYVYGTAILNADGSLRPINYPIKIDGILDGSMAYLKSQDILSQTLNPENLTPDFKGSFKGKWDSSYFYIYLTVGDKDLDSTTATATDKYNYDNFVINLDVFNKKTATYIDTSQMYWEIYWWNATFGGRYGVNFGPPPTPLLGTQLNIGTGYTAEFAIAWDSIRTGIPQVGDSIGFDLKLNNRTGTKRTELSWWDITDNGYANPTLLGTLVLKDSNNIEWVSKRPAAPDSLIATVTADTVITLTWPAVDSAASYRIYGSTGLTPVLVASNPTNSYQTVKKTSGTYIYSVRTVDSHGVLSNPAWKSVVITVTTPVGINNTVADNFKVYPIPTTGDLNISGSENILMINVLNTTGQTVKQYSAINTMNARINISDLPRGTYFIQIYTKDSSFINRVVKQ